MPSDALVLDLPGGDPAPLAEHVHRLVASQAGWITLLPGVPEEAAPPPPTLMGRLFSANGPWVPVCTWVAPQPKGKPPHVEVGVLHATGPKAERTLAAAGHPVPTGWVVLGDSPKRGLVVAVHPDADALESVTWLIDAGTILCLAPMTGMWRAEIHPL